MVRMILWDQPERDSELGFNGIMEYERDTLPRYYQTSIRRKYAIYNSYHFSFHDRLAECEESVRGA